MSVTAAKGFVASGVACGLKESGARDLSLVVAKRGVVSGAATFTTNRACAAPVVVSKQHLVDSTGRIGAVILNSGGANAATGPDGMAAALKTCELVGTALGIAPHEVLVCSTGLIGKRLPIERITTAVPDLIAQLGETENDARAAAEAIMTTDTHPKQTIVRHGAACVGGMAKGAGMIAPNMATMLAVLTTDAEAAPPVLQAALRIAVGRSFNELTVDGCTSTNDTVALLASGEAGPVGDDVLIAMLTEACEDLAYQLADDAEGTTKVARIHVTGAQNDDDARLAARRVAGSLLVKTSLYGSDPYWGRIISELGASGCAFTLDTTTMSYGDSVVFASGHEVEHDATAISIYLASKIVEIHCDLGLGDGSAVALTTDLGHGYVDENMRTS